MNLRSHNVRMLGKLVVVAAGMFGFGPREFFDVGEENRATLDQAPQVKFN